MKLFITVACVGPAIAISVEELANSTYAKIIPCLLGKSKVYNSRISKLKLPADAEDHYQHILEVTKPYRGHNPHEWNDYKGPWIENIFISHFINSSLSTFGGLIPLFVQWTDIHVNHFETKNASIPRFVDLPDNIAKLLRDDVIYFTVSQDDQGITSRLADKKPNILQFSAGGYGHIPIPLIKGELEYVDPSKFVKDVSFVGSHRPRLSRSRFKL